MIKWIQLVLLTLSWVVLVVLVFVAIGYFRKPDVKRNDAESIQQYLDLRFKTAEAKKRFGCAAVVLIQQGEIKYERLFGTANDKSTESINPQKALFLVSSVSKAVTSWGIMKLVQEGKIGLDDPVLPYLKRWRFPESGSYKEKVTVRMLMSHTSGIVDGFGVSGVNLGDSLQTIEEALAMPADVNSGETHPTKVEYEPGTSMSYSSAGYLVLQLLIEEITGMPFSEYMSKEVLIPLGMKASNYDVDKIISEGREANLVASYDTELKIHPHRHFTNMAGVSLRATPHDLAVFLSAFYRDNPVLSRETIAKIVQPEAATGGSWGLGHEIRVNEGGNHIVGHAGGAFPRTGASGWINVKTGNGILILMTGGNEQIDTYIHDWLFWETGLQTLDIRIVFHDYKFYILVCIIIGAAIIIILKIRKHSRTPR